MGVQGLWELLAPVGRRVSVDTLGSRKLAIDASIWIVQFMKAMRDDQGDMIRNAHLLGFFRRICKLLFLRIKPVFVFDGATPALKRRTVIARRRQRENAQSKIRKTAEKLLLNHIRTRKLEEIAADINHHAPSSKSKMVGVEATGPAAAGMTSKEESEASEQVDSGLSSPKANYDQMQADAQLAASLTRDYGAKVEESDDDDEEELILPPTKGLDPSVLASLPPSMQLDLLVQMREQLVAENRQKFQNVAKVPSTFSQMQIQAYLKTVAFRREINEVQKAAAGGGIGGVPTARVASTTDREFIFSKSFEGDKPAPSEVEEHTRVQQTPPKKANPVNLPKSLMKPSSVLFSSMTNSQENAATEEDGVVSLVSTQLNEENAPSSNSTVHTYIDERGHVRVNRRRGMGVRMTRDLQWNLYLMKDSEARNAEGKSSASAPPIIPSLSTVDNAMSTSIPVAPIGKGIEISFLDDGALDGSKDEDGDLFEELISEGGDASNNLGSAVLDPSFGSNNNRSFGNSDGVIDGEEDQVEWEDGGIHENGAGSVVEDKDLAETMRLSLLEQDAAPTEGSREHGDQILLEDGPSSEESEVEWEDGTGDMSAADLDDVSKEEHCTETLISGEEEAEIQEAIRRSLEDFGPSLKTAPQLIIKEPAAIESRNRELERPDASSATRGFTMQVQDDTPLMRGESEPEEVFLARERTRKGKAVLSGDEERIKSSAGEPAAQVISEQAQVLSEMPVTELTTFVSPTARPFQGALNGLETGNWDDVTDLKHVPLTQGTSGLTTVEDPVLPIASETKQNFAAQPPSVVVEPPHQKSSSFEVPKLDESPAGRELQGRKDSLSSFTSKRVQEPSREQSPVDPRVNQNVEVELVGTSDQVKSSAGPSDTPSEKVPMIDDEDLLREAENFDIETEREQLQNNERAIAAEMERLAREEANLQEELEMEQEEIRSGIEKERELLEKEQSELRSQQRKNERNAESVTGEMFAEVQELLQMFGLPYLIAPMEAEAQCAFMDIVQLVDGVVTDDSDAFLFGGRTVYKNLFDDRKYVETYYMKDLESEMGMTREKLIRIAMLLGSDYTEGISGIGIVNAIETVNAFPEKDGLQKFKEWLDSPDHALFEKERGRSGGKSKGNTKDTARDRTEHDDMEDSDGSEFTVTQRLFMGKHRAVSKNWTIPESFPSEAVVNAYISPTVDKSKEAFSWGRPDLEALRNFCHERFIWTKEKADELLLPVLKEYDRRETQTRLESFYQFNQRFAKIRSSRIQKAVTGMTGKRSAELMELPPHLIPEAPPKKSRKKRVPNSDDPHTNNESADGSINEDSSQLDESVAKNRGGRGRGARGGISKRKGTQKKEVLSPETPSDSVSNKEVGGTPGTKSKRGKSEASGTERGRGRGRGRDRGRGRGRGGVRAAEEEESASDGSDEIDGVYETIESVKNEAEHPRRSNRQRNLVGSYLMDNSDDEAGGACSDGEEMFKEIDTLVADALQKGNEVASQRNTSTDFPVSTVTDGKEETKPSDGRDQTDAKDISRMDDNAVSPGLDPSENVEFGQPGANIPTPAYMASGGGFCPSDDEDVAMPPPEDEGSGDLQLEETHPFSNQAEEDPPKPDISVAVDSIPKNTSSEFPRSDLRVMPQLRRRKRQD